MDDLENELRQLGLEFVGPFEHHDVVLNGRRVPYLSATPLAGGRVYLSLDNRFALELSLKEAEYIVPFIAHCLAVGMGYTGFPDTAEGAPLPAQHMPRMRSLD